MRIRSIAVCVALLALTGCPRSVPPPASSNDPAAQESGVHDPNPSRVTPVEAPQGKRAAGQENAPVLAFRGFGTEPFWSARVDGETLVFSTPENQEGTTLRGSRQPSLTGYVFAGQEGGREFNLSLTPGECSDGMSDNRYSFTATFTYGGASYKGCGEVAK